eukprot:TRINITY_DN67927_c5_g7_i3.p1 TRINITY_DN67927_c5_g7~~TRINITY_DN67927_c5_g7_i3.p1  ORF type:complete len:388 (+),score=13.80 TRINITY_DN67927_c5_g7_i3:28-1191(+)
MHSFLLLSVLSALASHLHGASSQSWELLPNKLPVRLGSYYGVTYDPHHDIIIVVGGYSTNKAHHGSEKTLLGTFSAKNSSHQLSWSQQPSYPVSVLGNACFTNSVRVYCTGGDDGRGHILQDSYVAEISDSRHLSKWEPYVKLPIPVHFHVVLLVNNTQILLLGGRSSSDKPISAIYQRTSGSSWRIVGQLPQPMSSPAVVIHKGRLVVGGGQLGNERNLRCQLKTVHWTNIWTDASDRVHIGPWVTTTDYVGSKNYISATTTKLDSGIKAYHWMTSTDQYLYVFPAASFSTVGWCKQNDTKYLTSTMRSYRALVGGSRTGYGNWTAYAQQDWGLDRLNYIVQGGMGSNVYGLVTRRVLGQGTWVYLVGGMNYQGMLQTVWALRLEE